MNAARFTNAETGVAWMAFGRLVTRLETRHRSERIDTVGITKELQAKAAASQSDSASTSTIGGR